MKIGDKIWLTAPDGTPVEVQVIRLGLPPGLPIGGPFPDKSKTAGLQVKELRIRKGVVQKQLANMARISEATVVRIEKGGKAHESSLMAIYQALIHLPDKLISTETSSGADQKPNPII